MTTYTNKLVCSAMRRSSLMPCVAEMPDEADRRAIRNRLKRQRKKARK